MGDLGVALLAPGDPALSARDADGRLVWNDTWTSFPLTAMVGDDAARGGEVVEFVSSTEGSSEPEEGGDPLAFLAFEDTDIW